MKMSPFSKFIPLIALACLCQLSLAGKLVLSGNSVYTTQQRFEKELIENMTTPRIHCYKPPHPLNERRCTVSLSTNDGERTSVRGCPITLKPYTEDRVLSETYYDVQMLDKDVIMVSWLEFAPTYDAQTGKVNLRIVARLRELWMDDYTTTKHETQIVLRGNDTEAVDYAYFLIHIVPNGDTFDVLYTDKGDWDGYDLCKQTYERNRGKPVGRRTCIPSSNGLPPFLNFYPIDFPGKSSRGYLVILLSKNQVETHLIDAEGTSKRLSAKPIKNILHRFRTSSIYNVLTLCDQFLRVSTCTQYELDGTEKGTTNITLGQGEWINNVRNLPNGGFVALIFNCFDGHCTNNDNNTYYVAKVDSDGTRYAPIQVPEFKCNYDILNTHIETRFFENEANELCAAMMCYTATPLDGAPVVDDYRVMTKCFSDKEFQKKRIE